jgi:hypothetical protein
VLDQHTTLKDAARALRAAYGNLQDADEPADAELRALFNGFGERVLSHFALEEGGGYFDSLAHTASPALADQIAHLKGEHEAMTAELGRLHAAADARMRRREFAVLLDRFLDRFDAHELHEDVVLSKLLFGQNGLDGGAGRPVE